MEQTFAERHLIPLAESHLLRMQLKSEASVEIEVYVSNRSHPMQTFEYANSSPFYCTSPAVHLAPPTTHPTTHT